MLAAKRNNYLAAAVLGRDAVGLAYADMTTGEFACTQFCLQLSRRRPCCKNWRGYSRPRCWWRRHTGAVSCARRYPLPAVRAEEAGGQDDLAGIVRSCDDGLGARPASPSRRAGCSLHRACWRRATRSTMPDWPRGSPARAACLHRGHPLRSARLQRGGGPRAAAGALRRGDAGGVWLREAAAGGARGGRGDRLPARDAARRAGPIHRAEIYSISGFMVLDAHTRRNLELFESGRAAGRRLAAVGAGCDAHADGRAAVAPLAGGAAAGSRAAARPAGGHCRGAMRTALLRARLAPRWPLSATWSG